MKAIIVDLDGTLLRTDKTLSAYTLDVLKKCHEKGLAIIAATARPERSILMYHEQVGFDAMITLNGAKIILSNEVIENSISHLSGKRVLSALISVPDTLISIETSDGIYSSAAIPEWDSTCYDGFPDLPTQGALYKILASSTNDTLFAKMEHILTEDVYYSVANNILVQIMSKSATKWNGIQAALAALDILQTEAIYFGDDNDDIEPIQMCGIGVAVSNAIEAVANAADHITGSNDEDGVARFIEANLLKRSSLGAKGLGKASANA